MTDCVYSSWVRHTAASRSTVAEFSYQNSIVTKPFMNCLSLYIQMLIQYLKIGYILFFTRPFQLKVTSSLDII